MTKDWVHGVGHSPVCQILLQIVVRAVITCFPPAWTSSAGMLSTPADFPFFSYCNAASTSLRSMGWSSSVSVLEQFSTDGSPEQYSVHRFSLSFFREAFSCTILDSSSFPLFHSGYVFHFLYAPLNAVVHFPVFLRPFRFKSFISQFSSSVARIKTFCIDPGFLLLTMFANDPTGCFSHCCVEGGDHSIHVCIFIVHDGERCKLPEHHSLEGFQHIGIFQLLEIKHEFCVLVCSFFSDESRRSSSAMSWSLPMSAPGELCVLVLFTSDRKRFLSRK